MEKRRIIKFRAKHYGSERYKNNEWLFGMLLKGDKFYFIQDEYGITNYADEDTIGQYTGLKDKNGKEIYEGDILKLHYIKNGLEELIASVAYSDDYAQYIIKNDKYRLNNYEPLCDYEDLEVMGNIYDNPELLKEE